MRVTRLPFRTHQQVVDVAAIRNGSKAKRLWADCIKSTTTSIDKAMLAADRAAFWAFTEQQPQECQA
jgi:hypothetical protein